MIAALLLVPVATGAIVSLAPDGVEDKTRALLVDALRKELGKLTDSRNANGKRDKRANYSQFFEKQDDGTYFGSLSVNTAGESSLTTERYRVVLTPAGDAFEVSSSEIVDSFTGLHRFNGSNCYPFETFKFNREGLVVTASNGGICEGYFQGRTNYFMLMAPDLKYDYQIPEHVSIIQQGHDFFALRDILSAEHQEVIDFTPDRFSVSCDEKTCEE
ncbi:MAG: hypothetical protein OER88_12115, partial [Planctomycetota bacterium]|nr:hypothetical protein [Planctomycetota bacterium]